MMSGVHHDLVRDDLLPGVRFTIVEGPKRVGRGTVLAE
jgi:hypothetical protein